MSCHAMYGDYVIANAHSLEACYEEVLGGYYSKRIGEVRFHFLYENGAKVQFNGSIARILLLESKVRDLIRGQESLPALISLPEGCSE